MVSRVDAQPLNQIFASHPICLTQHALRKTQILEAFSDYVDETFFDQWHLCLHEFASERPLAYVCHKTIKEALDFFCRHSALTVQAIHTLNTELSHAIFSLFRPGTSWNKEEPLSLDDPKHMAEFESIWHPEYQRYCEHVFNHLIQVPLFVLELLKHKSYRGQALANRVEQLRRNGLSTLSRGHNPIVRNAISHGSTTFGLLEIIYTDKHKGKQRQELLSVWEFAEMFDALVENCHSVLVALLLFICNNKTLVHSTGLEHLPLGLRFVFVEAFASHHSFQPLSMIESPAGNSNNGQLNIACRIDSQARWVHVYEGMNICWQASRFGGQQYERFGVSLDCGMPVSSNLFINGRRLQQAITNNESLAKCAPDLMQDSLLWFDASRIKSRIYLWKSWLLPRWELTKKEIIHNWRSSGLKVLSSRYTIRHVQNKSSDSIRRIEAHVVLHRHTTLTKSLLQDIVRHAVKKLRKYRVSRMDLEGEKGISRRPCYVWIRLYAQDSRIRTLMSYGWKDEDLILRAEWFSLWQNKGPIFVQTPDVVMRNIRIEYNPNLTF